MYLQQGNWAPVLQLIQVIPPWVGALSLLYAAKLIGDLSHMQSSDSLLNLSLRCQKIKTVNPSSPGDFPLPNDANASLHSSRVKRPSSSALFSSVSCGISMF